MEPHMINRLTLHTQLQNSSIAHLHTYIIFHCSLSLQVFSLYTYIEACFMFSGLKLYLILSYVLISLSFSMQC